MLEGSPVAEPRRFGPGTTDQRSTATGIHTQGHHCEEGVTGIGSGSCGANTGSHRCSCSTRTAEAARRGNRTARWSPRRNSRLSQPSPASTRARCARSGCCWCSSRRTMGRSMVTSAGGLDPIVMRASRRPAMATEKITCRRARSLVAKRLRRNAATYSQSAEPQHRSCREARPRHERIDGMAVGPTPSRTARIKSASVQWGCRLSGRGSGSRLEACSAAPRPGRPTGRSRDSRGTREIGEVPAVFGVGPGDDRRIGERGVFSAMSTENCPRTRSVRPSGPGDYAASHDLSAATARGRQSGPQVVLVHVDERLTGHDEQGLPSRCTPWRMPRTQSVSVNVAARPPLPRVRFGAASVPIGPAGPGAAAEVRAMTQRAAPHRRGDVSPARLGGSV